MPLGATEQHGPHLPHSVDTDIAAALCAGLAAARPDVVVAPALPFGASGEHAGFPGTLSIGHEALRHVLVELGRSATDTFARVLFVSAHGGNGEGLRGAVTQLQAEGRDVAMFEPRWAGEPHAGRTETSMMLALRPGPGADGPGRTGRPAGAAARSCRCCGPAASGSVSPNGVLGDPRARHRGGGRALLTRLTGDLVAHVDVPGVSAMTRGRVGA